MGGREKGEIRIDGERLIDIVVRGARDIGCERVVIAGETTSEGAVNVREEPRFGGPVAGLGAALPEVPTEWLLLLACDLPRAAEACRSIAKAAIGLDRDADGVVATADGRAQWLTGWYRRDALQTRLDRLDEKDGFALRDLMSGLDLRELEDPDGWSRDVDTPDDLDEMLERKDSL